MRKFQYTDNQLLQRVREVGGGVKVFGKKFETPKKPTHEEDAIHGQSDSEESH